MRAVCFLLLIFLIGCKKEPTVPKELLQIDAMSALMIDMYLLESKVNNLSITQDSANIVFKHFFPQLLEKHQIDSLTYLNSMKFYVEQPKLFHDVNARVVDSLSVREKTFQID